MNVCIMVELYTTLIPYNCLPAYLLLTPFCQHNYLNKKYDTLAIRGPRKRIDT